MSDVLRLKVRCKRNKNKVKAVCGFVFSTAGLYFFVSVFFIIMVCGAITAVSGRSETSSTGGSGRANGLPTAVEDYRTIMTEVATEYGIPEYVDLLLAIMATESGGKGSDPMQSAECGYNTKYPHIPSGITDARYSIECGVQTIRDYINAVNPTGTGDLEKIKVVLQGYNFGGGYISDAQKNNGGIWTQEHTDDFARRYSNNTLRTPGTAIYERAGQWAYGDQYYTEHVLFYYHTGGSTGDGNIVNTALSQLGNSGGEPFWSWYGFSARVEWCACFVSWVLNQCGYTEPKFSYCPTGVEWFKAQGKWADGGTLPSASDIIFFDWDNDGISDHVGIVESCDGEIVYTVEGNSEDMCLQRRYSVSSGYILGYGEIKIP